MPDPHVVYIVTAVVVLALVVWVGIVLARPAPPPPGRPAEDLKKSRPPLNSHLEIQDHADDGHKSGDS